MDKDIKVNVIGCEQIPHTAAEIPDELKPVLTVGSGENKEGIESTLQAVIFLLAVGHAIQNSLDDGKVTVFDAVNFISPVSKLPAFLTGIKNVPAELADTITEDEQAEIIQAVIDSGVADGKAEAVAIEAIQIVINLKNFVFKNFIKG